MGAETQNATAVCGAGRWGNEKILLVDDDPVTLKTLEKWLAEQGFKPLSARTAFMAIKMLQDHEPRLVICDWLMPKIDGLEICRRLRACRPERLIYIIMLTIRSEKSHLVEAFEAGVDDFLCKPFHTGELLARIRAGMRIIQLHDEQKCQLENARRASAELAQVNKQLKHLAATDDLTGLLNRRQAFAKLNEFFALSRRYRQPLSCAIVDVDDFKRLNDDHGHLEGDEILQNIAAVMAKSLRAVDIACRIGGDEFLLLLPNQPLTPAAVCLKRCRANIEASMSAQKRTVGISIGLAELSDEMTGPTELFKAADEALYNAKRAGKNTISL